MNPFKAERDRMGLTQEQVAKKIGVSRSNVANWENNQNLPRIDLLIKVSDFFGCDVEYLTGHQSERIAEPKDDEYYERFKPELEDLFSIRYASDTEKAIIECMMKLNDEQKQIILSLMENMKKK